jgi:hypothetical protein
MLVDSGNVGGWGRAKEGKMRLGFWKCLVMFLSIDSVANPN